MIAHLARGTTGALPGRRHVIAAAMVVQAVVIAGWIVDAPGAVRLPFGLVYLLVVPGFALVGLLRLSDAATEVALSVAGSIALGAGTAQTLVWAGAYNQGVALYVLGVVSFAGLALQYRDTPPGTPLSAAPAGAFAPVGSPADIALPRGLDTWVPGEGAPAPAEERTPSRVGAAVAAGRAHLRVPMFRTAYALIGSTVLTTGFGMIGWIAAARLYPVAEVGRGQSAVNAMVILSGLGNLRLMNVLTRFLPRARERSAWLVGRSYLLAVGATLGVCGAYLLVDHHIIAMSELVGGSPLAQAWFVVAVVAFAVFTLQDAVLTGLRRATWVPLENGAHGALKLVVVVACAAALPSTGIFASWVVPTLVVLVPVNLLIFRRLLPANAALDVEGEDLSVRRLAPFTAAEYAGALCELAVANVIPLVIAQQLGLAAAGVFGAAWLIGTTLDHVVVHFGASLTVEAAAAPTELARLSRELLTRSAAFVVPMAAVVALGAPWILALFGAEYSAQGGGLLRLLGLALVPRLFCTVAVVVSRVRGNARAVVGIQAALALGTLAGSFVLLDDMGLVAPGAAYLASSVVVAAVVGPVLVRDLAPRPQPHPQPPPPTPARSAP